MIKCFLYFSLLRPMQKHPFKNIVLLGFLIGVLFIVFIQFISSRNINRLLKNNQSLLQELRLQNDLRKIESDILTIESDIRGAVLSRNPDLLKNVKNKVSDIDKELLELKNMLRSTNNLKDIERLEQLVRHKIEFSNEILDRFYKQGKEAGEELINTGRGGIIRDSIVQVINLLDSTREQNTLQINSVISESGRNARVWVGAMALIACTLLALTFWYILNLSSQQQRSIAYLNESEKKIKEAAAMKEQFMANMSHEIRTPMNAIIGFTNILKRTELSPDQRQYVQNIHSAGENLLALINDILDLSKIEAGMMQLEETNFSFRSLVGSVSAMFYDKLKEKNLSYKTKIEEEVPDILCGDAVRLTQILVNLLGNAAKFTNEGEVRLETQLISATEKKVEVQIKVIDTGIGIAKEKQARIFERFQQAESETTRKFGGTGLGLSIVRQLVELQGGTLNLFSEQGKGSQFIITIPYNLPDEEKMLADALASESQPVIIEDVKVLVAEDNIMNQQLIRHLMKNWSMRYSIVSNGAEAIEALKQDNFSVVLMDIQMPEIDGYTATGIIRNELQLDVPIIAMTAHAMTGEKEKCLQLGMNDYISKPLKETVLYNIIAQYSMYSVKPKT